MYRYITNNCLHQITLQQYRTMENKKQFYDCSTEGLVTTKTVLPVFQICLKVEAWLS